METIRLLTFSTLYPNNARPNHGIFVENRLRHLVASEQASSTVVAPVPWFPSRSPRFGDWARHASVAPIELRHGITVHHPRYPVIPWIGMSAAPYLLYRATLPTLRRLLASGQRFDAIDAHYVYPDGVAAVWLGRTLGLPTVVTARGTDVNLIPRYVLPRALIRRAIAGAAALIAVSAALKNELVALGAPDDKVTVLRNGVDLTQFRPVDRAAARAALGLTRPTLLSVGHLIERKGHHRVIEAMTRLPEFELLIVGEGPEHGRLAGLDRTAWPCGTRQAPWWRGRMPNCRHSTALPISLCWLPAAKVGQMFCWKRWHAAHPSSPAIYGAIRKWFAAPRPA